MLADIRHILFAIIRYFTSVIVGCCKRLSLIVLFNVLPNYLSFEFFIRTAIIKEKGLLMVWQGGAGLLTNCFAAYVIQISVIILRVYSISCLCIYKAILID